MKRRDLVRKISQEAKRQEVPWKIDHEGARHSVYRLGTRLIPVSPQRTRRRIGTNDLHRV
ncbi:hypothetical protein [Ferrimicrobium acidiphilum]|uniref:hypothetical protein n=1 Tax=Ferrimicrobium acidiphilum TaxID=121039 RepID=UPI0023F4DD6A|nr:hypothetical protein [Ferrimicrobium acidiphilum]MCL5054262.1 hypothetical protein [Gammaproteobacteria bacterium]